MHINLKHSPFSFSFGGVMPGTYHVKASHASWSFENVSIMLHINFSHYTPFCTSIIIDFLDCIILFTKYKNNIQRLVQYSLFVSAVLMVINLFSV